MTGPKNNPNLPPPRPREEIRVTPGYRQKITPERQLWNLQRTEEKYRQATMLGEHLWVAALAYFITPPMEEDQTLDADSMVSPPMIGCFICEIDYSERELHRRCKGEPNGGPRSPWASH